MGLGDFKVALIDRGTASSGSRNADSSGSRVFAWSGGSVAASSGRRGVLVGHCWRAALCGWHLIRGSSVGLALIGLPVAWVTVGSVVECDVGGGPVLGAGMQGVGTSMPGGLDEFPITGGEAGGRRMRSFGSVGVSKSWVAWPWVCWPAKRIKATLRAKGIPRRASRVGNCRFTGLLQVVSLLLSVFLPR